MTDATRQAQVTALLRAGQIDRARDMARSWLEAQPRDAAAQYVCGLAQMLGGDLSAALQRLEQAVEIAPDESRYRCNLGHAYLKTGRHEAAVAQLTTALELRPDYPEAEFNLGCAHLEMGETQPAADCFLSLVERFPGSAEYVCAQADAARLAGRWQFARRHYQKALELDPDFARAHSNLGALLPHFGERDTALEHCLRAVQLMPKVPLAHLNLGRCLAQLDQPDAAMDAFADAYDLDSNASVTCTEIGRIWLEVGELDEACRWFQRALQLDPDHGKARCGLAQVMLETGNAPVALELLAELAAQEPADPEILNTYSSALWDEGDAEVALQQLHKAQALQPQNAALFARSGQILASAGQVEQALNECHRALDLNPQCVPALNNLATNLRGKLAHEYVSRIEGLLQQKGRNAAAQAALHSSLAYFFDGTGEFGAAAKQMDLANRHQWEYRSQRGWNYDPAQHRQHCEQIRTVFSSEYFQRIQDFGIDTLEPVYIIGMPRSGTTLTEQILGRHPAVLGIGERNFAAQSFQTLVGLTKESSDIAQRPSPLDLVAMIDQVVAGDVAARYLQQLATLKEQGQHTGVLRVVDKMPDNYSLLGWILTLFPRAKVIHCRRDPRDVALSCWMTQFGKIQWACQWQHLTNRIAEYQRLMVHWRRTLPERFLEIDYESLVHDQETESRRLIDWLELDWDPACLKFYESDRLVRTASITQVRQPIYKRSIARWCSYQHYIPELTAIPVA